VIPEGYRPSEDVYIPVYVMDAGSGRGIGIIEIDTDGKLKCTPFITNAYWVISTATWVI